MTYSYDPVTLVKQVFQFMLGRSVEPAALGHFSGLLQSGAINPNSLIQVIADSEEYRIRTLGLQFEATPEFQSIDSPSFRELSAALEACAGLTFAEYEAAWSQIFERGADQLVIGQPEYGVHHKQRFFELVNAVACLNTCQDQTFSLMEFGPSEFTRLYKGFFNNLRLTTADRPVADDYVGFNEEVSRHKLGAEAYVAVDLCRPDQFDKAADLAGTQDLVLFCEVLEHLDVHPVEVLHFLLRLIKPDGHIYLTTPNFFRAENRRKFAAWENPQEVYPIQGGNWDAHHHHREYGFRELVRFVAEAGGTVRGFYHSGCWDADPKSVPVAELGNLVFVLGHR